MSEKCIVTHAKSSTENLCDTCKKSIPTCDADEGLVEYGDGRGNDNIVACGGYDPREVK